MVATLTGFSRPSDPIGPDLAPRIAAATGLTITDATCTATDIKVTGPSLVAGNKPAIQTFLNGYVYDPDFFLSTEAKALKVYSTLKQWASDAATVNTNWSGLSAAQKDNAMQTTIARAGILCDKLADFLRLQGVN